MALMPTPDFDVPYEAPIPEKRQRQSPVSTQGYRQTDTVRVHSQVKTMAAVQPCEERGDGQHASKAANP